MLISLFVMGGMILKFGKYERFAEKTYEIIVVFSNVGGIVKDASVLYGGISVGKVHDITLDQEGLLKVNVKLAIYGGVKIREDARFVINQSGLLGDRYIDVVPQSATAAFIKPGQAVQGSTSVDLSEAIRSVVDVLHQAAGTIERVDKAIQRIDETVFSRPSLDHISASMANLDAATSNAVALTLSVRSVVDESRGKIDNALAMFSQASINLEGTTKRFDGLITDNQADIRAATKNLAESTERLNALLTGLQKGQGTAGKILVDPTLHDEIVKLVQNWRKYGLLYKEGSRGDTRKPDQPKPPATNVQPGRPAK